MSYMFSGCQMLQSVPKLNLDTSQCTGKNTDSIPDCMGYVFDNCQKLTSLDLSNWDVSNVDCLAGMFNVCTSLKTINISTWDTSKVEQFEYMFADCFSLEHIEGVIDMSSCQSLDSMFFGCSNLTGVKLKNLPNEFNDTSTFELVSGLKSGQYEIIS